MRFAFIQEMQENFGKHPQAICLINPKYVLYGKKVDWLKAWYY